MKKKTVLRNIFSCILLIYLALVLSGCSGPRDIVIYQTVSGVRSEIYRELFTENLEYTKRIENSSIYHEDKHEHGFNVVEIKDGLVRVIEANCPTGSCKGYTIKYKRYTNITIICLPNQLEIVMEPHQ